jgi:hypothetical protein
MCIVIDIIIENIILSYYHIIILPSSFLLLDPLYRASWLMAVIVDVWRFHSSDMCQKWRYTEYT